jgi:hypothetical protein
MAYVNKVLQLVIDFITHDDTNFNKIPFINWSKDYS